MNQPSMRIDGKSKWTAHIIKSLDLVTRLSWYASSMALFLILSAYIFEVVMRYFLSAPTSWSSDVIQWFLAAMIMLALPEVTRINGHIVISFFLEKMKPTSRQQVGRVIALIGCIMCMITAWICWQETFRQYDRSIETLWSHPIPKWWISAFIPFGFVLSGFQMLRSALLPEQR
jgi:TRAP-type C4-dicarboxylate transport system permease small subunit